MLTENRWIPFHSGVLSTSTWNMANTGSSKHEGIFIIYFAEPKTQHLQTSYDKDTRTALLGLKRAGKRVMGSLLTHFSSGHPCVESGSTWPMQHAQHHDSVIQGIQLYKKPHHTVLNHCQLNPWKWKHFTPEQLFINNW